MRKRPFIARCRLIGLLLALVSALLVGEQPASACTSVCLAERGHVVFGNNLDWFIDDALLVINKRDVKKRRAWGDNPPEWVSKYGSITTNLQGNGFPNRGMNEAGLVIGEMWLGATIYPDPDARPSVDIAQWIQYQLDTYATVAEVLATDAVLRIGKEEYKSHFLVCDATGACAAVEWLDGKLCSHRGDDVKVKALVNSPYADCLAKGDDPSGRFAKAARLLRSYTDEDPIEYVFSILRATRQNHTRWSLVFDVKNLRLHYFTQRNPALRSVSLRDFDLSCRTPVQILDINAQGSGDVGPNFAPFTHEENARIARAMLETLRARGIPVSAEDIEKTLNYHTTMQRLPDDVATMATLTVQADKPGAQISPTMWGVFLEDINFAADGGLHAELVKNRSFEFPDPMMGWSAVPSAGGTSSLEILDREPFSDANPHYLRISVGRDGVGVSNEGFRGMGIRADERYVFSAQARAVEGRPTLRIQLITSDARGLAEASLDGFTDQWQEYSVMLRATTTEPKARLNLLAEGPGTLDLDMVSLFPERTWKNRPKGLRTDLVEMLADLKPGFIKFPGGFLTEGRSLDTRYQWKKTIGDLAGRKLTINAFAGFPGRAAPDYFQSYGLGFFEYFQLCEDLGAEPQPVLSCGMAAQFTAQMVPLNELRPCAQDVLDLIELANGAVTSPWGEKRAELGHPKPFNLRTIRLGNEQQGQAYIERYERLAQVIHEKHPDVTLVAGSGPDPDDENFNYMWAKLREFKADMVDEHAHKQPDWFFGNVARYDRYDRSGPKVMAGEWAAHSEPGLINPNNRSNLECALAEAAFMTGLERNADLIVMSCYAPLFGHVDAWQWVPNLIWFDNLNVYGTPSYYVQQMFSHNRGDVVLPVSIETSTSPARRLYATAARDNETGAIIIKAVNPSKDAVVAQINLSGVQIASPGKAIVLTSPKLTDENSFEAPRNVFPVQETLGSASAYFQHRLRPYSFTVLRLPTEPASVRRAAKIDPMEALRVKPLATAH